MKLLCALVLSAVLVLAIPNVRTYTLADFPAPFVVGDKPAEYVGIVVGDYIMDVEIKNSSDVNAAMRIHNSIRDAVNDKYEARSYSKNGIAVEQIDSILMRLASEVPDISTVDVILVGGPCANNITARLLGNPEPCYESVPRGKAQIKLVQHGTGHVSLIINGRSGQDTERAVGVLFAGLNTTAIDMLIDTSSP